MGASSSENAITDTLDIYISIKPNFTISYTRCIQKNKNQINVENIRTNIYEL